MQEDTCSFHPMKTHRNSMVRVDICKNPVVNSWFLHKLQGPFCTSRAAVCGCFLDVHISQAWCWRNFWKKKSSNMFFFSWEFTWILLRWIFCGLYHGKSPSNQDLDEYFSSFFQASLANPSLRVPANATSASLPLFSRQQWHWGWVWAS